MAKVRITGFSTEFELENQLVGIGTDNPTNTLQVLGNIHSSNAKAIGVSTLPKYQGFVDSKVRIEGAGGSKSGATSNDIIIEGNPTVSSGTTLTSGPENLTVTDNFTLPGISDDKPTVGSTRFNEDLASLEFYTGVEWKAVNSYTNNSNRGRGVFGGGSSIAAPTGCRTLDYVNIASTGNAAEFGFLEVARNNTSACSSSTRGIFGYGNNPGYLDSIEYITLASGGNGTDFGNISTGDNCSFNSNCSSSTRGVFTGGYKSSPSPYWNLVIDYVEMATTGNAKDFGDPYQGVYAHAACSSSTRGVMAGGFGTPAAPFTKNLIQQFTISTKGNSVRFGELHAGRWNVEGASNSVRGVFGGGSEPVLTVNTIDYITIASEGNAILFGELTLKRNGSGCASSETRVCWAGGYEQPARRNIIDYVNIATQGDAIDFGDLTNFRFRIGGCSDSHGGLGGF